MSGRPPIDDELEEIFKRPSDVTFAQRLHESRQPMVEADPAFKEALRRRLMQEAWKQKEPRRPWYRRLLGPPGLAWAGAMAGVLLIVFATVTLSQSTTGSNQRSYFTSPQNGRQVATTTAIVVNFPQPMNPTTTQSATQITPATEVTYKWSNNDQTLTITPKNGPLAPGVQYQVDFSSHATTQTNEPLTQPSSKPSPITFVTQEPTPTPTAAPTAPPASPAPTAPPSPLSGVRLLGASGNTQPVWSQDGSLVFIIGPNGQLTSYPSGGGVGTQLAASGVTQVAAGPDGPAYLAGTNVTYDGKTTSVPGVTSIGFEDAPSGEALMAVAGTKVTPVGGTSTITLKATPEGPVQFSPNGADLVYVASDGLHLVALPSGADQVIGAATGLGAWSPDGTQYAFTNQGALSVLAVAATSATAVVGISGVSSLSWTNNGLVLTDAAGVQAMTSPTGKATTLAPASAGDTDVSGSPAAAQISYVQGGNAYVGTVDTSSALAAASNVVTKFMAARLIGNTSEATSLLSTAAQQSFSSTGSGLNLTADGSQTLKRWSIVLAQPSGVVVVRSVFAQGTQQSLFYEQYQVAPTTTSGQWIIQSAAATQVASGTTGGPAIETVSVSATSISVRFDSDVNPTTVPTGVTIANAAGSPLPGVAASYSAATRAVTVTYPTLTAGQQYQLVINPSLKDVDGHPATHLPVIFTSPTTPPAAPVAPNPSPSPSASPTPSPSPTPTTGG